MGLFDKKEPEIDTSFEQLDDVSFACQMCYVQVEVARFYRSHKLLVWVCPEGHRSFIEGVQWL